MMYFDNNATTALDPAVLDAMQPHLANNYANPSSPYTAGRAASAAIALARQQVAELIGAKPEEIVFTSGGTESNNAVLRSAAGWRDKRGIVITSVEHASVIEPAKAFEHAGSNVTRLPVDRDGRVDLQKLRAALTEGTALLSAMAANNETGILFPIAEFADAAHRAGALFHTDAVQAAGKTLFNVRQNGADFASLGAHKIHGPKGVGALFIRQGAQFAPVQAGGDQEYGRRAGTENVAGIVGFGAAAVLALRHFQRMQGEVRATRDRMEERLLAANPEIIVVGKRSDRLPNTSSLLIRGIESEALIARLDLDEIACSSGSACASGAHETSHVLRAMGFPVDAGWGALRISLSRFNTQDDVDCLVERLIYHINVLRMGARE